MRHRPSWMSVPVQWTFIRLVFPNHQTRAEHVTQLLDLVIETAERLEREREVSARALAFSRVRAAG